jgi:predicted ATP-grasp superfamily ATP-dependent carboligase
MMAGGSKFAYATFTYPSPYTDPTGFVDCIAGVAREHGAGVYIPIHEEIMPVARYIDRLPEGLSVPIGSYEQLIRAYNKATTMAHAEAVGVPIPKTVYPESLAEAENMLSGMAYPAIIKLRKGNSAKGVFKVNGPAEAVSKYAAVLKEFNIEGGGLPIVQEYIAGPVYAISMLFDHGRLRAKFSRKNIREKTYGGGTCTKCISVRVGTLEAYAEKLLSSMEWHGVAMMEFKYDEKTDRAYLLEINPRYHGTIDHDIQSGVPTPYLHYLLATGRDIPPAGEYRVGFKSRWILGDLIGLLDHVKYGQGISGRLEYLLSLLRFDEDNYMDLKKDDLKPFFLECLYYLKKFIATGSKNPVDEGMLG